MNTYCMHKSKRYKVSSIGSLSDKFELEHGYRFFVNTQDDDGRYVRLSLVECADFKQAM